MIGRSYKHVLLQARALTSTCTSRYMRGSTARPNIVKGTIVMLVCMSEWHKVKNLDDISLRSLISFLLQSRESQRHLFSLLR